jgi:hypothetical protein
MVTTRSQVLEEPMMLETQVKGWYWYCGTYSCNVAHPYPYVSDKNLLPQRAMLHTTT